jgi:ribosomal protein L11 methyltransferase
MTAKRIEVGRLFGVFPFYEGGPVDAGERIPILLGHGRAFGSGEHETTASCLEEIERIHGAAAGGGLRHRRVLDLGSGTGILAVAAAKLGARSVAAVEPDPEAVRVASRNILLNGVQEVVEVIPGDKGSVSGRSFDLVLANIYGDVLLPVAPEVTTLLAAGGRLVLSGIHYDYAFDIKKAYTQTGLAIVRSRALENYCTIVLAKA